MLDNREKIAIASHRLPMRIENHQLIPSDGGLISALNDSGVSRQARWFGCLGEDDSGASLSAERLEGQGFFPVHLRSSVYDRHYNGFCNQVIWPAFHHRADLIHFEESYWRSYVRANVAYAEAIRRNSSPETPVWVQDYHLMLLPAILKKHQPRRKVSFFLHIPWPARQIEDRIPHLRDIVASLMKADVVGFHTERYKNHFSQSAERFNATARQSGKVVSLSQKTVVADIPIGIAAEKFSPTTPNSTGRHLTPSLERRKKIIGVDRLDYSKGIDFKLLSFHDFLEMHPEKRGNVVLHQLLIPTRDKIPAYNNYRNKVVQFADYINRKFGTSDWTPVQLTVGRMTRNELSNFYRSGDICFVASCMDGMNLVSMEYLAAQNRENPGVLLLSRQAGASEYLSGALQFNALDIHEALRQLWSAIKMPKSEKIERWRKDMKWIGENSATRWALTNIRALGVDLEPSGGVIKKSS